jgi:hypothetical protein
VRRLAGALESGDELRQTKFRSSFDCNFALERPKPPITDPAHNYQMFGAAKWAEPFAMVNDALGQTLSNARELFEFSDGCSIDIDTLHVCWIGRLDEVGRIVRLLIVRLGSN